jgi:putative PEP-CTERM system histidine kinase
MPEPLTATAILWTQALAALLFAAWSAMAVRDGRRALGIALGASAGAALAIAGLAPGDPGIEVALALRETSWVVAIIALLRRHAATHPAVTTAAASVVAANLAALVLAVIETVPVLAPLAPLLFAASTALRMTALAGGLLLLHFGVRAAARARDTRGAGIGIGLGLLWLGELAITLGAWSMGEWDQPMFAARAATALLGAGLVGAAITHRRDVPMAMSRLVAWRLLAGAALAAYLAAVAWASGRSAALAGPHARVAETAVVFGAGAALLVLVVTPGFRAWARVTLAKHLFVHRYDYRAEWQRFSVGLSGDEPMGRRIVRALAGFTDSPGGMLLVVDRDRLVARDAWNWADAPQPEVDPGFTALLATGWLVELDDRNGPAAAPSALLADRRAWVVVPLIHDETLVAAVVLARPPVDRRLDWEDFDLLRVAGRHAASQLAEDDARAALAEARRFDEFHRRFAFIMHDLKNLVSQMTLTASNARRHADNPAFRADMVATLGDCAERMNALIARLSNHGDQPAEPLAAVDARSIAATVARRFGHHPVRIEGAARLALAHPSRLEQVLAHLVQNAVEASGATDPVIVALGDHAGRVAIEVIDRGVGMSAGFVHDRLFRPFASSKPQGFGLGAFEARQLVDAMGGTLDVDSREGDGTRFRILLPAAAATEIAA